MPTSTSPGRRLPLAARLAGVLVALALGALGVYTVAAGRYYHLTKGYGRPVETLIEGPAALWPGLALIAFGLSGLFVFARTARGAGAWIGLCMTAGVLLMLWPAYQP